MPRKKRTERPSEREEIEKIRNIADLQNDSRGKGVSTKEVQIRVKNKDMPIEEEIEVYRYFLPLPRGWVRV